MHCQWLDIQAMPYYFLASTIKWKADLEDEKRKKMDEKIKEREQFAKREQDKAKSQRWRDSKKRR